MKLSKLSKLATAFSAIFALQYASAQTYEYVETATEDNHVALGVPVPIPVDSLTPLNGFRTYASLHMRHQQLEAQYEAATGHLLGQTLYGRDIWGYQLSDADSDRITGGTEQSALINAGIHAREWQSPEASTGFIENLLEPTHQNHIADYLLQNLNLMIIPVLNIDGFLQTQRFPNFVTSSINVPRDGRMRRKNLNSVDEDIATFPDNLMGVDLNRNNAPYWATSDRSSSAPESIVHHGTGPASEPETKALQQGAAVIGDNQLAFYQDVHSFSQLYFVPNTGNGSRDLQTSMVANAMVGANSDKYLVSPSNSGSGIGATDEYFANTYQVPAFTLEIEPRRNITQYGGNNVSHSGFILPASEVLRMREETSRATFAGLYMMTDATFVERVQILDGDGNVVFSLVWNANSGSRELENAISNELSAGTDYRLRVTFNKPMRDLTPEGEVTQFGTLSDTGGVSLSWSVTVGGEASTWTIDSNGTWGTTNNDIDFERYQTDTYEVAFQFPAELDWGNTQLLALEVNAEDLVGNGLDSDPSTIATWQNGQWNNFDGGNVSGIGGTDSSMVLINDPDAGGGSSTPAPPPPPVIDDGAVESSSGGGGSLYYLLGLILFGFVRRR